MKISLGADHGGFEIKETAAKYLKDNGYEVVDVGTFSTESCHYPEIAKKAAELVSKNECHFGFVFCTTGQGVMISANKFKGVRCGLAFNDDATIMMRKHNDANMAAFGAKYTTIEEVIQRIKLFLNTKFDTENPRHQIRVEMIKNLEK